LWAPSPCQELKSRVQICDMGIHFMGMHLIGVHLIGVYLIGVISWAHIS
jgi:hypothetical protein